jgi:hypothetical protein
MANIVAPVFDEVREHPGFNCRLEGAPSLRTPAGRREMEEGEVVSFLVGEDGVERRPEGGGLSQHFSMDDGAGYFDFEGEDAR